MYQRYLCMGNSCSRTERWAMLQITSLMVVKYSTVIVGITLHKAFLYNQLFAIAASGAAAV